MRLAPMQRAWLFAGLVACAAALTACSSLPVADVAACLVNVCNEEEIGMVKIGMTIAALAVGAASLTGCDTTTQVAVTSAICTDAVTLQSSGLALNKTETTALQGVVITCGNTAGGTVFSNSTVALALINDAILLQSSGLLKDIHITALAPAQKMAVKKIDLDIAKFTGK